MLGANPTKAATSTDDALLKRLKPSPSMKAALPAEALAIVENWYED